MGNGDVGDLKARSPLVAGLREIFLIVLADVVLVVRDEETIEVFDEVDETRAKLVGGFAEGPGRDEQRRALEGFALDDCRVGNETDAIGARRCIIIEQREIVQLEVERLQRKVGRSKMV